METLERNLRTLSSRASDVEEEVMKARKTGTKKRKREVETSWLEEVKKIKSEFPDLKKRVDAGGLSEGLCLQKEVTSMNNTITGLLEQSENFQVLCLGISEKRGETRKLFGETFCQNWERIWACLVVDKVSSIGIYGVGGVGKTTLTKHIYNLLQEKSDHDNSVHWLTVSQGFSIHKLQTEVAKCLRLDISEEDDEDKRAAKLTAGLRKKESFTLVLDDVWECLPLKKIGDLHHVREFRVIVTARSKDICNRMDCQKLFELKTLCTDEAWNLFRGTLGHSTVLLPEVENIAKSVAEKCNGLPLGIITLAASMRGVTDIRVWSDASEKLKEFPVERDDMESKVYRILRYSFSRLADHGLLECFLYCCLYPQGHPISRDELINKFISEGEGMMKRRTSRQEEFDQGHAILKRLEDACLLEIAQSSWGSKCVKMHDLVRDVGIRITKDKKPVKFMVKTGLGLGEVPDDKEWAQDLDKVSLMRNNISVIPKGRSPKCPGLSTLFLQENYYLKSIPNSFFAHMKGLKVLDLRRNGFLEELPESISNLRNLSALFLGGCRRLTSMPSLEKLESLEQLDISGTGMKQLPNGMGSLRNLKVLDMGDTSIKLIQPEILAGLSGIQHLTTPRYIIPLEMEEVIKLRHLEEFNGKLFGSLQDFKRFFISGERYNPLRSYSIVVSGTTRHTDYFGYFPGSATLVLSNHQLGEEDEFWLPEYIQSLTIKSCDGIGGSFLSLLYARSLRNFTINNCEDIECILRLCSSSSPGEPVIAYQRGWSPEGIPFQYLETLSLFDLSNLYGLYKWEASVYIADGLPLPQATFSSLKNLKISGCHRIKKLLSPVLLQRLHNLKTLYVCNCNGMEEIIAEDDDKEGGDRVGSISRYPTKMIDFPHLRFLTLNSLPELRSVCRGTLRCDQIKRINLSHIPKTKRFPLFLPVIDGRPTPPLALIQIRIRPHDKLWWESLEWDQHGAKDVLQPFVYPPEQSSLPHPIAFPEYQLQLVESTLSCEPTFMSGYQPQVVGSTLSREPTFMDDSMLMPISSMELLLSPLPVLPREPTLIDLYDCDWDATLSPAISKKKGPEETTVGLDDEILTLKERLLWGNPKLEIVSIVGMPGLGKTTLARRLYNDPLIMYEFQIRAWAYVSQPYDKRTLLLQILSSVLELTDEVKEMDDNKLEELLRRGLIGSKYLIILDDIWSVEPWNYLKRSLPNDINGIGSKIVFTSRVKDIAVQAHCYSHSYSVRHLTEEESWTLLQRKIFQQESCPLNLADVGPKIAARCQGLPLALVLIAGVLADNTSPKWWEQVAAEVDSFMLSEPNQYMQTLELSYKTLPDHLKSCFLYFGVFPQGYEVPARKLCLLWVSGGVTDQTVGNNKSEVMAEGYLMDLVNRSLISVARKKSSGGIKSCRVHDLLHNLCVRKAKEERFSNRIVGYRELSLVPYSDPVSKQQQPVPTHSMEILDVMTDSSTLHPCSILYFTAETCPFLMDSSPLLRRTFSLVEMLDLSSVRFLCFPVEVVCLVHLKYLALQADNGSPPTSISNLQCLETLIVSSKSRLAMPSDIWNIRTLRHLYTKSGKNILLKIPCFQRDQQMMEIVTCWTICKPFP